MRKESLKTPYLLSPQILEGHILLLFLFKRVQLKGLVHPQNEKSVIYSPFCLHLQLRWWKPNFVFILTSGAIKRKVELDWGTEDMEYLQKVELHSEGALNEVRPDIIIYNAGTDILDGDPLGGLAISPQVQPSLILPFSPPYQIRNALLQLSRVF